MKLLILSMTTLFILGGCSSNKKYQDEKHENLEKDYVVKDSNSKSRPGWIEDAEGWAAENNLDLKVFKYYSYETTPKVGRKIACNLAKAYVKTDIAGEISTKINQELTSEMAGNSNVDENSPELKDLKEMVSTSLNETIDSTLIGAQIKKTYWEKRFYQKDLGAKKDYEAFTCAVFVQIDRNNLAKGLDLVQKKLETATEGKMPREEVRKIILNTKQDLKI